VKYANNFDLPIQFIVEDNDFSVNTPTRKVWDISTDGSIPQEAERMSYFNEISRSMTWLGEQDKTVFLGQSVVYSGNAMYKTLESVPSERR